jgi:two-component system nitrate/nitrite response regulator NarL
MLTVSEDERDLAAAFKAGAQGYLLKTMEGDALVDAIECAMRGDSVVSPNMTGKLVNAFKALHAPACEPPNAASTKEASSGAASLLSPREREILGHIALGASNKEIGRALHIAETTVKIHVQHILRKLGLSSRVQAAVYATERGLA